MKRIQNKLNFRLLSLAFLLALFSCQSNNLIDVVEETYDNGDPKLVLSYDKKDIERNHILKERTFYPGNKKRSEGEYIDGQMNGHWIYWYENGNKWSEGWFDNGVETENKTVWHENGQKYYEGKMENGSRIGQWDFWEEDGTLIKSINYDQD